VSLEKTEEAIQVLSEPDLGSRSKEYEGRRIKAIDGGWLILNGEKYRRKSSIEHRREYQRDWKRNKREEEKEELSTPVHNVEKSDNVYTTEHNITEHNITDKKKRAPSELTELAKKWNELCPKLPQVSLISPKRLEKENLRLKRIEFEKILIAILKISKSDFCHGKNDRGWRADYGWLIESDENILKAIEGKYDNRGASAPIRPPIGLDV